MQFTLIDRIVELEPNSSIHAVKCLSLAEDYLQDHFPRFPVMPGVLMLESMYQAGAWLVHRSTDFAYAAVILKEARNVKYADFVTPGMTLKIRAEVIKQQGDFTTLKAEGTIGSASAVSGRLVLERYNWADKMPQRNVNDARGRRRLRQQFELLYHPQN
jgi:3-hydroxyacyl-[acyl-carrier-protein] dehydratase